MSFDIEFYPPVQDEIRSWPIKEHVVREFYLKLADDAQSDEFLERIYEFDPGVFEYKVSVEETSRRRYMFFVRMRRWSENLFRIHQCTSYATLDGNIKWSSSDLDIMGD